MREPQTKRVFLLSPANASGKRAQMVLRPEATFELAERLRESGAPLGEVYSFVSGLYFRGKLAYARAFAEPPAETPGVLIITAARGLVSPDASVTAHDLRENAEVQIDQENPKYRQPLERDALDLARRLAADCEVVLLGSVATPKYVQPLLGIFGERLMFPSEFTGRGDMSRGGLMLRAVRAAAQLSYAPIVNAARHGQKPAKLPKCPGILKDREIEGRKMEVREIAKRRSKY